MRPIMAVVIGLALISSASAAQFMSSPTPSPFPEPQQYAQPQWQGGLPPPIRYEQPNKGYYCQQMQGGTAYCYPLR